MEEYEGKNAALGSRYTKQEVGLAGICRDYPPGEGVSLSYCEEGNDVSHRPTANADRGLVARFLKRFSK